MQVALQVKVSASEPPRIQKSETYPGESVITVALLKAEVPFASLIMKKSWALAGTRVG